MRRGAALLALLAAGCTQLAEGTVDPAGHSAFYLWAGVDPPSVVDRAATLYMLAGEVRRDGSYLALRATPRVTRSEVWLVIRAARIDWTPSLRQRILTEVETWAARNRLVGLQIDFDAATPGLGRYAEFLNGLREDLPAQYQLSVTGLMDWSANGDPAHLAALKGTVDEVVVQSYQGRSTILGYENYLARLARVPVPHKVALVEGGMWNEPAALRRDPLFRGYVVFLLPRSAKRP